MTLVKTFNPLTGHYEPPKATRRPSYPSQEQSLNLRVLALEAQVYQLRQTLNL